MSASPARQIAHRPPVSRPPRPARADLERRRRQRLEARRRRDLLEDTAAALVLTIVAVTLTAGLGVIALIEVPVVLALVISYVRDRRQLRARRSQRPLRRTRE